MHFAVGMACAGIMAVTAFAFTRRGWRWLPVLMTLGGVWAVIPDVPATLWYSLGFSSGPASSAFQASLSQAGNLFFFHNVLDSIAYDHQLLGGVLIVLLYNLAISLLMVLEKRARLGLDHDGRRTRSLRHKTAPSAFAAAHPEPYDMPVFARVRSSHLARTG